MVRTRSGKTTNERIRWTDKMLRDLLYCKSEALRKTNGKDPPMKDGRQIGYIEYMLTIWLSLGYEKLGKTPHSLCSAAYNAERKFNITSNMLMSTSSSTTSYGNTSLAVQEVCQSKDESARNISSEISVMEESKEKACHYYRMSIYAALLAIFMTLSLVFGLLYSRCYLTFGDLIRDHLTSSTKTCNRCHEKAFCQVKQTVSKCVCEDLYVGDGETYCHATSFAMRFNENTKDYPTTTVSLTKSSDISFCVWLTVSIIPTHRMSVFLYSAEDTPDEFKFSLTHDRAELIRNTQAVNISIPNLRKHFWNHYCCTWQSNGLVRFYINFLNVVEKRLTASSDTRSLGHVTLGAPVDDDSLTYNGIISQFFMYNRALSKNEILRLFKYQPSIDGLVVSWKNFSIDSNSTMCEKPRSLSFPLTKGLS